MKTTRRSLALFAALAAAAITSNLTVNAQAQTESILYKFPGGRSGENPSGPLIFDSDGNLYGTTPNGGGGGGTVFRLSYSSSTSKWTETVLRSFSSGALGQTVAPGVVMDAAGNLYGATALGGDSSVTCDGVAGCGIIFELSPSPSGPWKETILHRFTGGADGALPTGQLLLDGAGNLYGTAAYGGNLTACTFSPAGCGVVFKLSPSTGGWRESVLFTFNKTDGWEPQNGLVFDAAGNLYGTAEGGGSNSNGVAFQLTPTASGPWNENILFPFAGSNGSPINGLVIDSSGNLYGAAQEYGGGCPQEGACGSVYELSQTGGTWTQNVLWQFEGLERNDGAEPQYITLSGGNIYGVTFDGGVSTKQICDKTQGGCGTVFELTPSSGSWTETVLYNFNGYPADGAIPESALAVDASGNLYGTTFSGGEGTATCQNGCGTVFEVKP